MAFTDGNVIQVEDNSAKMILYSGFSTTITNSFSSSSIDAAPQDLSSNASNMIMIGTVNDDYFELSGFSSTVNDSIAAPSTNPRGITFDGSDYLAFDVGTSKVYKHTGFTTTIGDSFSFTANDPDGLSWGGSNWYSGDAVTDKHFQYSGFSSSINDSYSMSAVDNQVKACSPDGTDIVWSGNEADKVYKNSGFSSTLSDSYAAAFSGTFQSEWDSYTDRIAFDAAVGGGGFTPRLIMIQ